MSIEVTVSGRVSAYPVHANRCQTLADIPDLLAPGPACRRAPAPGRGDGRRELAGEGERQGAVREAGAAGGHRAVRDEGGAARTGARGVRRDARRAAGLGLGGDSMCWNNCWIIL